MNAKTPKDHADVLQCSCGNRFKKITDNLYECLTEDISCDNKFAFGSRHFCSWLMYPRKDRSENNFPCMGDDSREKQS